MESQSREAGMPARMRYIECEWGDLIYGTKEQLQQLGLGIGRAFPGEAGGPRRTLNVRDARGYPVEISAPRWEGDPYTASVRFPHWPKRPDGWEWIDISPGLRKREGVWFDEYQGVADVLVAAGVVRFEHLPGQPGMRKMRVAVFPDGTIPDGPRTKNHPDSRLPGARRIARTSGSTYCVTVVIDEQERAHRARAREIRVNAWEMHLKTLRRPARLQPMPVSRWAWLEESGKRAARDTGFQAMLKRLVRGAQQPSD